MSKYYFNSQEYSLRKVNADAVQNDGSVKYEGGYWMGHESTATKEEWNRFMIGAIEVPGLLWHFRLKEKAKREFETAKSNLEGAEQSLISHMEYYITEFELSVSRKIEAEINQ